MFIQQSMNPKARTSASSRKSHKIVRSTSLIGSDPADRLKGTVTALPIFWNYSKNRL